MYIVYAKVIQEAYLNKYNTKKYFLMYMPRLCYGYVKKASLNKYKKIYISQCICQGYVMAMSRKLL